MALKFKFKSKDEIAAELNLPPAGARRVIRQLGYAECLVANAMTCLKVGVPSWFMEPFREDLNGEIGSGVEFDLEFIKRLGREYLGPVTKGAMAEAQERVSSKSHPAFAAK